MSRPKRTPADTGFAYTCPSGCCSVVVVLGAGRGSPWKVTVDGTPTTTTALRDAMRMSSVASAMYRLQRRDCVKRPTERAPDRVDERASISVSEVAAKFLRLRWAA